MIEQNILIRSGDLLSTPVSLETIAIVSRLMTPKSILEQTAFEQPIAIAPYIYHSFSELVADREMIRHLKLLPVKSSEARAFYHQQPKDLLYSRVLSYLGESPIALASNGFPDMLPDDVGQFLVWIRNHEVSDEQVVQFIAQCMEKLNLSEEDLILFERSRKTTQPLVRGTFAEMRHIHFWTRMEVI